MQDDDDGIIDLKALSKPPAALATSVFASETPPAFTVEPDRTAAPARSSTGKIIALIGGALVLMALTGFGLRMLFRTQEPISRTAPPPPPPVVVAAAPPPPAPEPAADPAPAASDDPAPPPAKKKGRGGKFVRPAGGAAPSPKAADPCGCKGSFDCNLRCAAAK